MDKRLAYYIVDPIIENKFFGLAISLRRMISKIYSLAFLANCNITTDYTSYIYGLKYMDIGKLTIGKNCRIEMISKYNGKKLKPLLKVGQNVIMNDMVHIGCANYVEIGDNCVFASRIYVSDHNHGSYKGNNQSNILEIISERLLDTDKPVIIGKNVWIGEGVAILPGSQIGDNTIIGANSVVRGEIPANSIAVGNPARVIKNYNIYTNCWDTIKR